MNNMHNHNDIERLLESTAPTLSRTERAVLWTTLEGKLGVQEPIPSPFIFNFLHTKSMASILLILMLIIGGGGTALASDAARPGDLLFPVERAFENTRLKLAVGDDSRNKLKTKYADERLRELQEILSEESEDVTPDSQTIAENTDSSPSTTAPVSEHRNKGKKLKEKGEERVGVAVHEILSFLDDSEMSDAERARVLEKVFGEMDALALDVRVDDNNTKDNNGDDRIEIRRNEKGEERIEIRDGNERIRIEEKNGEVRIRTEERVSHDAVLPVDDDKIADERIDTSFEAEADIFTDTTIIKIEWHDETTYLQTTARTRESIVTEITKQFDVSYATVDAVLDLEEENRASRPSDMGDEQNTVSQDDEDDDRDEEEREYKEDEDDEDDDEDEDEDESRKGSDDEREDDDD